MRVLITGAAGFIGSHLADAFLERDWQVTGVDNLLTGRNLNVDSRVTLIHADVSDSRVWELMPDADLVVHCAASYSDPSEWQRDVQTNTVGTLLAAQYAKAWDARLLYFQTSLPPVSSYAISKIAGEHYLALAGDHVVFRLANIYGPRNLSGPIPTFWKRITNGDPCTVVDTSRDMVFIADLVRGVLAAIDSDVSGRFDMCSGTTYAIRELFDAVASEVGVTVWNPQTTPAGPDDVSKMELDPLRVWRELGWKADTTLREGVADACDWYATHGVDRTFTHLKLPAAA